MSRPRNLREGIGPRAGAAVAAALWASVLLWVAFSRAGFIPPFVDADKLLPADLTRRIFVDGLAWTAFQLPRIPSFFPDLAVFSGVQVLTSSWRIAIFVLAAVLLAGLAIFGGVLAGRAGGASAGRGIAAMILISTAVLVSELLYSGAGRHFTTLQAVAHGGSFVLTLACVVLLRERGPWARTALILLVAVAVASDRIFVVTFAVPAILVSLRDRKLLVQMAGAVAAGWLLGSAIYREADYPLGDMGGHITAFVAGLTPSFVAGTIAPLAFLLGFPLLVRPFGWTLRGEARNLWVLASISATAPLILTALFYYEDIGAIRYLSATLWWPLTFGAALLTRLPGRVLGGAVVVAALLPLPLAGSERALWTWRPATTACLEAWGVDQGLAGYWVARPTEIAGDWRVQVDQIGADGRVMLWGNDLERYSASRVHPGTPTAYRFVIMTSLDPAAIERSFGKPAEVRDCDGQPVWLYDAPVSPFVR